MTWHCIGRINEEGVLERTEEEDSPLGPSGSGPGGSGLRARGGRLGNMALDRLEGRIKSQLAELLPSDDEERQQTISAMVGALEQLAEEDAYGSGHAPFDGVGGDYDDDDDDQGDNDDDDDQGGRGGRGGGQGGQPQIIYLQAPPSSQQPKKHKKHKKHPIRQEMRQLRRKKRKAKKSSSSSTGPFSPPTMLPMGRF